MTAHFKTALLAGIALTLAAGTVAIAGAAMAATYRCGPTLNPHPEQRQSNLSAKRLSIKRQESLRVRG